MQSVQVLRTRGAPACEDCGRVGQRDQGLVSGNDAYVSGVCLDECAGEEKGVRRVFNMILCNDLKKTKLCFKPFGRRVHLNTVLSR